MDEALQLKDTDCQNEFLESTELCIFYKTYILK